MSDDESLTDSRESCNGSAADVMERRSKPGGYRQDGERNEKFFETNNSNNDSCGDGSRSCGRSIRMRRQRRTDAGSQDIQSTAPSSDTNSITSDDSAAQSQPSQQAAAPVPETPATSAWMQSYRSFWIVCPVLRRTTSTSWNANTMTGGSSTKASCTTMAMSMSSRSTAQQETSSNGRSMTEDALRRA